MSDEQPEPDESRNPRRIGNMNGPWALGFKIMISTYTLVLIPWSIWVTSNIYDYIGWKGKGERFSAQDAKLQTMALHEDVRTEQLAMRSELRAQQEAEFAKLESRIESLASAQTAIRESLSDMKSDFRHAFPPTQKTTP